MNDGERRESKWIDRAGFAGALAGVVLGAIGLWAAEPENAPAGRLPALAAGAFAGVFPGYIVGMIGTAARTPNRASLVGACLVGLPALLWNCREPTINHLEQVVGFAALGSIVCQVGAVASGTAACGTRQPEKIQFTTKQLLMFFIPVAIYFGYVSTLMRK